MKNLIRIIFLTLLATIPLRGEVLWIEGENPVVNRMNRHPWWYDQVKKEEFSGGDFVSNFDDKKAGEAEYVVSAKAAGDYAFWLHANPVKATLSFTLNGGEAQSVDMNSDVREQTNVAADGKPDLRFIAWIGAGKVKLKVGENRMVFRMSGEPGNHGYLDCFVLTNEAFEPKGLLKPDQVAAAKSKQAVENAGWFAFDPPPDEFKPSSMDLCWLNEKQAGDGGFIAAKSGAFVHSKTDESVRFWAVNGPPHELTGDALRNAAKMLAKRGVNLVRVHGPLFKGDGEVDPAKVEHALEVVRVMKSEGIYTHFSIYFPLWMTPRAGHPWLEGYDGKTHPFATLYFNPRFQEEYRKWWTALLTTRDKITGKTLVEEPAVMGLEMVNEDSFFFWTFDSKNIPDAQMKLLETRFGKWLATKHGSMDAALAKWGAASKVERDAPSEGRVGFRQLWAIANQKTLRDQETAQFLYEVQSEFYRDTRTFLRSLGFKGVVTASNWATASPEVLGPLEKLSYTAGDFIDRHGYFGGMHKGDAAEWSIREGHIYTDRSALRFDAAEPGKPKNLVNPMMDPQYAGMPSMISETTFNRPNRYRTEGPLFYAAYGALQATDGIVHFAFDGARWSVKPAFWMQPWTLASPSMLGQFPATALIFRKALIAPGAVLAKVPLTTEDLFALKGTPMPQDSALDELRAKDLPPSGGGLKDGDRIDPLIHFAGRTEVSFQADHGQVSILDLTKIIDRKARTVRSTTDELHLDYGKGVLVVNAAAAQGVCGALDKVGRVETKDASFESSLDLGCFLLVALDGKAIAQSARLLLQVMSEEKATGFSTEDAGGGRSKITRIGRDPWLVKNLQGSVRLKRPDASNLKVTALDANGQATEPIGMADHFELKPSTIYYQIAR
ncbi:MAG: hypothetical protein H8M99_13915 [Gloeobacteraceae cyanobacterium ES-bin-144]|nr:hypothetical protein [Verrucomicrobiales bacterium]